MKFLLEKTHIATVRGNPTFYVPFETEEAALEDLDFLKFKYRLLVVSELFNIAQTQTILKQDVTHE